MEESAEVGEQGVELEWDGGEETRWTRRRQGGGEETRRTSC